MTNKKNLSEDIDDIIDDAKVEAKKTAKKVSEKANEITNDAIEALKDGKNVAIISHITFIGWIVALIMNNGNKTELGSFYIRQTLGINLLALAISLIPILNFVGWVLILILWIISFIGALNGGKKTVFLLGTEFQEWFKSL